MPVPTAVGIAVAVAANTDSGRKAIQSLEELPLLAARSASDAAMRHGAQLPAIAHTWYSTLTPTQLTGAMLVAAAACTFSLLSMLVKLASGTLPSMEIVFWRAAVAWVLNSVAICVDGTSLRVERKHIVPLVLRSLLSFAAMALGFYAIQKMVLADASVLLFMSPLMTFFLGALLLKEKIDAVSLGAALFSIAGVVCVVRPAVIFGKDHETAVADAPAVVVFCALAAAATQSVAFVVTRRLQDVPGLVMNNCALLTTSVLSLLWLLLVHKSFIFTMSAEMWLATLGTGFLGFVGDRFLARGLELETTGAASAILYLDVALVFLWDEILLQEHINEWSSIGAVVVCGSAVAIAVQKMQTQAQAELPRASRSFRFWRRGREASRRIRRGESTA